MNNIAVMLAEKRFGGGTDAKSFGQNILTADRHPCALGSKALNVILFALKERFGNKHRHINILVTEPLELSVKYVLDILPDGVAVGTDYHAALDSGIIGKLSFFDNVGIPLSKINIH